jgi:hypothetical protein
MNAESLNKPVTETDTALATSKAAEALLHATSIPEAKQHGSLLWMKLADVMARVRILILLSVCCAY